MGDVVGAVAYEHGHATHIRGIRVSHRMTISFTTTTVDPDFPSRIAMPFYAAVPPDTKDTPALRPLPTAGPFYIRTYRPGSVLVLRRNPGYTGPRRGRARSIVYRLGGAQTTPAWRLVATGEADYDADPVAPSQLADARRAGAGHIGLAVQPAPTVAYLALNRRSPRMRDVKLRRAIALAINRRALARTFGPDGATPTDQYLPPVSPAYPGNGLAYSLERADVTAARRLISGTGLHPPITLRLSTCGSTCPGDGAAARARLLRAELARIGIRLVSHVLPREHQFILDTSRTDGYDIADEGFVFPNPDPDLITFPVTAEANMPLSRRIRMADHLPVPRRYGAWRRIDLALARRRAPLAAFAILNTLTLTNRRLGCLVVQPMYGLDLTRACVRSFAR
jgi:ABC-type transport system substrate-binding protein